MRINRQLERIEQALWFLYHHQLHMEKDIMATVQELKDKIAELSAVVAAEKEEVQAGFEVLKVEIQTLKDQIASGTVVTQEDLDSLNASVDELSAKVKGISEAA